MPESARNVFGYVNDFAADPQNFTKGMLAKVGGIVGKNVLAEEIRYMSTFADKTCNAFLQCPTLQTM